MPASTEQSKTARLRAALMLAAWRGGFTHEEIGRCFGIRGATVTQTLYRERERETLGGAGFSVDLPDTVSLHADDVDHSAPMLPILGMDMQPHQRAALAAFQRAMRTPVCDICGDTGGVKREINTLAHAGIRIGHICRGDLCQRQFWHDSIYPRFREATGWEVK